MDIRDKNYRKVTSLRGCTTLLTEAGITVIEKQATLKDVE